MKDHTYRLFLLASVVLLWSTTCVVETAAQQAVLDRLWSGLVSTTSVSGIAVKENAGYVVSERGLEVYNLDTSPTLRIHTTISLIPRIDPRVRLADDTLLLVWDGDTGVSIYSVVDPLAPRLLNHLHLSGVHDVDAQGTQLFAAWRSPEMPVVRQIDWRRMTDPPQSTDVMWSPNGFRKIQVSGRYLYGLGYGFDNDVIAVARIAENRTAEALGFFDPTWLFIQDFVAQDSVLLVVPSRESLREPPEQSIIEYGVRPGPSLSLVIEQDYPTPDDYEIESMALEGDLLVLHVERSDLPGHREQTLVTARIDGGSTLAYRDTLSVGLMRDNVEAFALDGRTFFWRNSTGLFAGDLDGEERLHRKGDISIGTRTYDVDGHGRDLVLAVTTDTLLTIDFSNPADPVFLSGLPLRAEGVAVIDRERAITFDSVVTLIDIGDPRNPRVLDTLNLGKGRVVWEAEVKDSVIVLCCLRGGTVVLVERGDRLHHACEIEARSTDALWMEEGLLLTTLDITTAAWEPFQVSKSQFEWCSPDQLAAWGKTGQAVARHGDTVVVATGNALVLSHTLDLPGAPIFLTAQSQRSETTGMASLGNLFFTESVYADKDLYAWESNPLDLRSIGHWNGLAEGTGRLYFGDSLTLFSAGSRLGLEVYSITVETVGVLSPMLPGRNRDLSIRVSPNVIGEDATLQIESPTAIRMSASLFDMRGREVRRVSMTMSEHERYVLHFDATDLPSGVYWLRVESRSGGTVASPIFKIDK